MYRYRRGKLHKNAIALLGRFSRVLRRLNLSNHKLKSLADIRVVLGAGFGPTALELLSQLLAFLDADSALVRAQIALVTDDNDWDGFGSLCRDKSV